jgi:hypothetical protein
VEGVLVERRELSVHGRVEVLEGVLDRKEGRCESSREGKVMSHMG